MQHKRLVVIGALALVAFSFGLAVLSSTFGPCRSVSVKGVGSKDGVHAYVQMFDNKTTFIWDESRGKDKAVWVMTTVVPENMVFWPDSMIMVNGTAFTADSDQTTIWVGNLPTHALDPDCKN